MAVFFNGQLLVTPTTASAVVDDAMQNQNLTVGNALALVGKSTGGKPKTVLRFGNPDEAKALLRGGELLDAVLKAFDPSAQTPAPSVVNVVRVNPAVQATLDLKNVTSNTVITLKSTNYGQLDNQIKVKVEAATVTGKKITVQSDVGGGYFYGDNINRAAFSIVYGGAEATAVMDITGTTVVLKAPTATTVATIDLAQFSTVGQLVDKINTIPGFSAAVLDYSTNKPSLNGLDYVTAANVKTSYTARADLQAVVDWFNNSGQSLVTAERAAGVGTLPVNIPFTYLAGGSEGTTITSDWSDGFSALQTADVQWLAPMSSDPAIHAMTDAHVAYCSTVLKRERRSVCGTPLATTDDQAITLAKAINSDRTSLCHLGYYDYNADGVLVLYPPYMTAAMVAAAFAGVSPGTPLTNKTLKVRGWERNLRNPTDTDKLILGGVLCVENTEQGFKVVQSISTWLTNRKYNKVEQSTGVALDFTVRNLRNALDILRGEKQGPLLLSRSLSIGDSALRELARPEPQGPGVIVGDENSPAYRNARATIEGDVLRYQVEVSPGIPNNYVLVTVYARPYSGSATL